MYQILLVFKVSPPPMEPDVPISGDYEETMANLCAMFSSLSREKIDDVLRTNGGRVEAAVDMLLAITTITTERRLLFISDLILHLQLCDF